MTKNDMQFYTTAKLGPHRELTPEGYLLCKDVPVARIGEQIYMQNEVPVEPGSDGKIYIERNEDQVFRPETLASLNGKSVVEDHPIDDVDPNNWKYLTVGIAMNAHRGDTAETKDLLLMDLLITTQQGMDAIKRGKDDISLGYDAKYEQIAPGRGRQYDIVCNHIALVDEGRCGPRCRVGDQKPRQGKEISMANLKKRALDLFRRVRDAKSEEELERLADELPTEDPKTIDSEGQHVHIHLPEKGNLESGAVAKTTDVEEELPEYFKQHVAENNQRFEAVNKDLAEIKSMLGEKQMSDAEQKETEEDLQEELPEEGAKDSVGKMHDSAALGNSFQETVALAEIIAPGISIPTFDSKNSPTRTLDCICKLRRTTLDLAWNRPETRDVVESVSGGRRPNLSGMRCRDVRTVFNAVGTVMRQRNTAAATHDNRVEQEPFALVQSKIRSLADLNKANSDYYKAH